MSALARQAGFSTRRALINILPIASFFFAILSAGQAATINFVHHATRPSDKVVVFIHGIYGDPIPTFKSPNSLAWPELMSKDASSKDGAIPLADFDIATIQYDAGLDSALSLEDIARQLSSTDLRDSSIFGPKYKDVFFIAHSMGGLAIKRLLVSMVNRNDPDLGKIRAVILIATPSQGSPIADKGTALDNLALLFSGQGRLGRPLIDLQTIQRNTFLQGLDHDWDDLFKFHQAEMPKVYCMFETKPFIRNIIIVSREYATTRCSEEARAENRDHSSIVKPQGYTDPIYVFVRGRINDALTAPARIIIPSQPLRIRELILFKEELSKMNDAFYQMTSLERRVDNVFKISTPELFRMPLGIVIENFARKSNGEISLLIRVSGKDKTGEAQAWTATSARLTNVDAWRTDKSVVDSMGTDRFLNAMGLQAPSASVMPMVFVVQCAKLEDLKRWEGPFVVDVQDILDPDRKRFDSRESGLVLEHEEKAASLEQACAVESKTQGPLTPALPRPVEKRRRRK